MDTDNTYYGYIYGNCWFGNPTTSGIFNDYPDHVNINVSSRTNHVKLVAPVDNSWLFGGWCTDNVPNMFGVFYCGENSVLLAHSFGSPTEV